MEFLKSLFTKPLSFEEFSEAATKAGIKLADLAKGEHVAKGKLTEATDKIKALESKVSEYETTVTDLKASVGDSEGLKSKIADLEKKIADRDAADKAAADKAALQARFDAATGDKKFINDFTRKGVFAEFEAEVAKAENKGKGDSEIYEALTKDREGIYVNPNAPQGIPGMGNPPPADTLDDNQVRTVMGLPPKN